MKLGGFKVNACGSNEAVPTFRRSAWMGALRGGVKVDSSNGTNALILVSGRNIVAAEHAVNHLLRMHPVLMAKVDLRNDMPWLVPGHDHAILTHIEHFGSVQQKAILEINLKIGEIVWRPFNLSTEPFFRFYTVTVDESRFYLGIVVHHFICDAISIDILEADLTTLYNYYAGASERIPRAPSVTYFDYLHSLDSWLKSDNGLASREGAIQRLRSIPKLTYASGQLTEGFRTKKFQLPAKTTLALRSVAAKAKLPLSSVLIAKQVLFLKKYCDGVVPLKLITMGREIASLAYVVGYLSDCIYLLVDARGSDNLLEISCRVQAAVNDALRYAFIRDDLMQSELAKRNWNAKAPVFNFRTISDYTVVPTSQFELAGEGIIRVPPPPDHSSTRPNQDYYFIVCDDGEHLWGNIKYSAIDVEIMIQMLSE